MQTDAAHVLLAQMRARTHVAPKRLSGLGPNADELNLIFSAASHAPDHGRIQPWRFIVVPPEKRENLGQAFVQALHIRDPQADQTARDAAYDKAFRAPCLMLAVVNHTPSEPDVPLQERLVSLGCAIQNMLLMAQALSIGSGITSGQSMNASSLRRLFQLTDTEQGICFLNFGHVTSHKAARPRAAPETFVSTL